jgi:HAD superfamily hydrolase (TIGR01509 family)
MYYISGILYDLDGVLVDAVNVHAQSFIKAVKEVSNFEITEEEHFKNFNGIPTKKKLKLLADVGSISEKNIPLIFDKKQEHTKKIINKTFKNDIIKRKLHQLNKYNNVRSACVTNSITETAALMLEKTGQLEFMDVLISNEAVRYPKPHGEGYIKAMIKLGLFPEQCVIVEDSDVGIQAAKSTGAHIWHVKDSYEVTWENFQQFMVNLNTRNL